MNEEELGEKAYLAFWDQCPPCPFSEYDDVTRRAWGEAAIVGFKDGRESMKAEALAAVAPRSRSYDSCNCRDHVEDIEP